MAISADIIAAALFILWTPSVGYVCRNRRGISGFLWLFIPLLTAAGLVRKGIAMARQTSVSLLIMVLAGAAAEVILIWVGSVYITPLISNGGSNLISVLIAVSFGVLFFLGACSAYGVYLFRRHRDKRLIGSFFSRARQFSTIDVLGMLDEIKTSRGVRIFVEFALRVNLTAHPNMIRVLSDIAAAAEVAEAQREAAGAQGNAREEENNPTTVAVPGVTPEFADWLKAYADKKSRDRNKASIIRFLSAPMVRLSLVSSANFPFAVRNVRGAMLDQIARSIEQVELARGTTLL